MKRPPPDSKADPTADAKELPTDCNPNGDNRAKVSAGDADAKLEAAYANKVHCEGSTSG